jgi:hypothetical protein
MSTTITTPTTSPTPTTALEYVPQVWDDGADSTFFALVARLFSPEFAFGASVLLASFDTPWSNA